MNEVGLRFIQDIGTKNVYPVYQPITNPYKKILGFEVLIRWSNDGREKLPGEFLHFLHEKKSWIELTSTVLHAAANKVNEFNGRIYFSINIPSVLVGDESLYEMLNAIKKILFRDEWFRCIVLEIPESLCLEGRNIDSINYLIRIGWRVELDDCFSIGSGVFPIRKVKFNGYKLDRAIVSDFMKNDYDASLIRSLIYFCALTGTECTAEGVDSHKKFSMLSKLGVNKFQGFEISKPVKDGELNDLIRYYGYQ